MTVQIIHGDCLEVLATLEPDSFHTCVCDPPYGIGFMGRSWDAPENVAFRPETWAAVYRVLRPGAHLLAFGGTRTYHRLACAIEDAGFEIRDCIMWLYGSGFPKSHDVSAAIDRAAGAEREVVGHGELFGRGSMHNRSRVEAGYRPTELNPDGGCALVTASATEAAREWQGWGTALKPAVEPIVVARKPLSEGTVAANVLRHGTGALNIDASRVATNGERPKGSGGRQIPISGDTRQGAALGMYGPCGNGGNETPESGRWPANVCHDGSPEVLDAFAQFGERSGQAAALTGDEPSSKTNNVYGQFNGRQPTEPRGDTGTAARFFKECPPEPGETPGRWPANVVHDGSPEVLDAFAKFGESAPHHSGLIRRGGDRFGGTPGDNREAIAPIDTGTAVRFFKECPPEPGETPGRWPANVCHDGSPEVLDAFAQFGERMSGEPVGQRRANGWSIAHEHGTKLTGFGDTGTAARFFFCGKADTAERIGFHPTVKPVALMEWLVQLVTPPGGRVLDNFCGTGSTLVACDRLGFDVVGIEQDAQTVADAHEKLRRMRARRMIGKVSAAEQPAHEVQLKLF